MAVRSTLLDHTVPLSEVHDVVAETWAAVQTGEYRLCLGLRRLFRDLRDGTFLGWGFDPERFEQGDPHVGTGRKEGDRAPPDPESRRREPA